MGDFRYKVVDSNGKEKSGSIQAANMEAARNKLKDDGFVVVNLSDKSKGLDSVLNLQLGSGVSTKEISVFCRQFHSLLEAGITVVNALSMLHMQTENKWLKASIKNVQTNVEKGETLANALRSEKKVFPELLINMVAAGEATGNLDKAFERITTQFEKDNKLKALLKSAMIYPIMLVVVATIVVIVLLVKVIPQFKDMLTGLGTDLPAITKVVIAASEFVQAHVVLILCVLIAIVVGIVTFKRTTTGKRTFSIIALKIPLFSNLSVKSASAKLGRTMSTLLQSGVPLVEAVDIVANTMSNEIIKAAMKDAKADILRGVPLSDPLESCGYFPPMVYNMVRIGEETGTTEKMLDKIADYYEEEVEEATKNLTTVLEPIMILMLAVVVGSVVMAVVMPMMSLYSALDTQTS